MTSLAVYIAGTAAKENFDFGGTTVAAQTASEEAAAFRLALQLFENVCNVDFVEVGSQVCVDRGLAGLTVVGAGTKIDNLTQIAHNVKIGRECIIVADVAIGGNARIGNQVFILGQVGIKNGISIGDGAIITAKSTAFTDIPAGRTRWAGTPAQEADLEWRQMALARRELPRLRKFFRLLKKAESFEELKKEFIKS